MRHFYNLLNILNIIIGTVHVLVKMLMLAAAAYLMFEAGTLLSKGNRVLSSAQQLSELRSAPFIKATK